MYNNVVKVTGGLTRFEWMQRTNKCGWNFKNRAKRLIPSVYRRDGPVKIHLGSKRGAHNA